MPVRKLPMGEELELEKKWFEVAPLQDLKDRAKQLDMPFESYTRQMRHNGAHRKEQEPASVAKFGSMLAEEERKVLAQVQQGPTSVGELSRILDRSKETIIRIVDSLRLKHFEVVLDEISREVKIPHEPKADFAPTEFTYFKKFYRIGLVADTHAGSIFQQMTLLHDAYSIFDERATDFNLHAGDLVDGIDMYRGHREELFLPDAEQQRQYVVNHYPKPKGRTKTYLIGGQHDRSFYKATGYNILAHICERRSDLVYKGFYKAQFNVKSVLVGLQHPGGGVSYARSYRLQKIVENMIGFFVSIPGSPMPHFIVFGHWHIPIHLPSYMGIDAISLPCFQSQTPYLEQKGLMPSVGFAIAEVWLDKLGNLTSVKVEFINMNAQIRQRDY